MRANPRPGDHDNITHALRAIAANEGRFLLTGQAIAQIVYGVTGRTWRPGGWSVGFSRKKGVLWEPVTMPVVDRFGRPGEEFVKSRGNFVWQLTDEGRRRLYDAGDFDRAAYDAIAWFPKTDFYEPDRIKAR